MKKDTLKRLFHEHARLPLPQDDGFLERAKATFDPSSVVNRPRRGKMIGWLTSGLVLVSSLLGLVFLGTQVRSTVSVDINPSLVLKLNYFDRVIGMEAANSEGEILLQDLEIRRGTAERVIFEILAKAEELGFSDPQTNPTMLLGVAASSFEIEQKIEQSLRDNLDSEEVDSLFLNKHHSDQTMLYSGLVIKSASALDKFFSERQETDGLTTTSLTTAAGFPAVEGNDSTSIPANTVPDFKNMNEEDFFELQDRLSVSEAKLTMAILVFNANDAYILAGDLEYLCHLPISQLVALYETIE